MEGFNNGNSQNAPSQVGRNIRIVVIFAIIVFVFAAYLTRLYTLQIVKGDSYRSQSKQVSSQTNSIPAQRGEIFDRNATLPMVINSDSFAVSLDPAEIPADYYATVTSKLAQILGIGKNEIDKKIPARDRKIHSHVEIKNNVSFEA
ncbi:MAG: penicillin-binding protein 2, partial [Treponema sp.]|nr:penicillin-binding protein 2 [Treponema sp.]